MLALPHIPTPPAIRWCISAETTLRLVKQNFGWGTGYGSVSFLDGSTSYLVTKGKISIDTHTTTAVTGKMYAIFGTDTDHEINGTFTLSRCCLSSGSYSLCSE